MTPHACFTNPEPQLVFLTRSCYFPRNVTTIVFLGLTHYFKTTFARKKKYEGKIFKVHAELSYTGGPCKEEMIKQLKSICTIQQLL